MWLQELDNQLLLLLNGSHAPWADSLMMAITGRWTWVPFYAALVGLLFWRLGWKRALVALAGVALTITLADQICASLIRPEVARLRPCSPDNPLSAAVMTVNGYAPGSFSFPSCHAANTFALAMFLTLTLRRRWLGWLMFVWAAVVSLSRLYLGVHYPSDLLAGAAIGMLLAWGVWALCNLIPWGRRSAAAAAALALCALSAPAQRFEWGGEFATFFDNREGNARHTPAETYFLTRLAPEIGVSFKGRTHRVMGGVVWTQPIGCEWDGHRVSPTLYYRYRGHRTAGSLGMFPKSQLMAPLPDYLESDSARYFQANLRGALLQTWGCLGYFEAIVDWRGMQTAKRREAFNIIARGEVRFLGLMAGGTAMLNHLAKVKHAPADQYVVDNLIGNLWVGLDVGKFIWPKSTLALKLGPLGSLTRDRGDGDWRSALGLRAEFEAKFWRLGLRNTAWVGNRPLFPLYGRYGCLLNDGEPYYASKWYDRLELSGLIIRYKDIVSLRAELDFHWAQGDDFMFYQRLILTVSI